MNPNGISAIVTGGASGLGKATAAMLTAAGAKVAIFDMNDELGVATANEVDGIFLKVDVTDEDHVRTGMDAVEKSHGTARIIVNCAGIAPAEKTVGRNNEPHSLALFRKTIDINLIGTFNVIALFAARLAPLDLINGERGVIVNTASICAFDGQIGQAAYSASKGGVVGMTLPVARDLAQHSIRVMTVAPGLFLTPMIENYPQHVRDSLAVQVPYPRRLGAPTEYAQLVECIIRNPMLNGEVIRIDGAARLAPK